MPRRMGYKLLAHDGGGVIWQEFFAKLLPGRYIAVWYDDDDVWHGRLLLYPLGKEATIWVVRTPDAGQYLEQINCLDRDGRFGGGADE